MPFAPLDHLGEVLSLAAQVGIEDFVMERARICDDDDTDSDGEGGGGVEGAAAGCGGSSAGREIVIHVDVWQCKAPCVGKMAVWGDLDAAIAGIVELCRLPEGLDPIGRLSDTVTKGLWGMCNLLSCLAHAASSTTVGVRVRFQPRTLYLRTTAVLSPSAVKALEVHRLSGFASAGTGGCLQSQQESHLTWRIRRRQRCGRLAHVRAGKRRCGLVGEPSACGCPLPVGHATVARERAPRARKHMLRYVCDSEGTGSMHMSGAQSQNCCTE